MWESPTPRQSESKHVTQQLEPFQRLACAVLKQALDDVDDKGIPPYRRQAAALFLLRDREGFRYWCGVAGLPCEVVRARAKRAIGPRPGWLVI